MRNTSRVAKNAISTKVVAMEKEGATFEQVRELVAGARGKMVYATGDSDQGIWSAGQVQGLIHDIPSCAELISRIMREIVQHVIFSRIDGAAEMLANPTDPRRHVYLERFVDMESTQFLARFYKELKDLTPAMVRRV